MGLDHAPVSASVLLCVAFLFTGTHSRGSFTAVNRSGLDSRSAEEGGGVVRVDQASVESARSTCRQGDSGFIALDKASLPWLQRCDIQRRPWPSSDSMLSTNAAEPYIVQVPEGRNAELAAMMRRDRLLADMGNIDCSPSQAGSVRKGTRNMRLREYIERWMVRPIERNPEHNRYVFGEFSEDWAPFRDAYVLPTCHACTQERVAVTIGLGGLHSGAPWHFHDAAFVEVLHGRKHFAFVPAGDSAVPRINAAIQNLSQLHWYLEERPQLERERYLDNLRECTINEGELLYFPPNWHHGVVNLDPYTAWVSTFLDHQAREDV